MKAMRLCGIGAIAVLLASCTASQPPSGAPPAAAPASPASIRLLAFGDSGYHYGYLEKEDYVEVVSEQQFREAERTAWIKDKRPIAELAYPPTYRLPRNGSTIAASGLAPVATAMKNFCDTDGCDFAVMLGDNIYPDGATANTDGRDSARFRDLFVTPFSPLAKGRADFRIYPVLGNHDWKTSRDGALAQIRFLASTPPFYMDGMFYRVTPPAAHGQLEIFAIDTEVLLTTTTVYRPRLADDGSEIASDRIEEPSENAAALTDAERNMARWLEQSLASSNARWKIVIGHHPLWATAGGKFEQSRALRRLILPALCKYADAYVAGHEHTLEVHTDDCSQGLPGQGEVRQESRLLPDAPKGPGPLSARESVPLLQVVSGSAAKMRPTNSAFIRHQLQANPQLQTLYARGLTWGFAQLTFEGERVKVRIVEIPTDGSATTRITFEQSFPRRSRNSAT